MLSASATPERKALGLSLLQPPENVRGDCETIGRWGNSGT